MKFIKIMILAGAFNWGAVGILQIDFVAWLFGDMSLVTRAVYALVFVSAIIFIVMEKKNSRLAEKLK